LSKAVNESLRKSLEADSKVLIMGEDGPAGDGSRRDRMALLGRA
jgi:pyruvate/2-oxoglutarate/acetoin dehydrogenase E1 component